MPAYLRGLLPALQAALLLLLLLLARPADPRSKVSDMLCYGLLTPYQVAKGIVVSYPFIPDEVAIIYAMMSEQAPAP